jgi:hypothetical protein
MSKKVKTKKAKLKKKDAPQQKVLTICNSCHIRLIVYKKDKCYLCGSFNIVISDWRKND